MPVLSALKQLGPDYPPDLVAEVFKTRALQRRAVKQRQWAKEKEAYDQFLADLTRDPDRVLGRLVELALVLCDAHSGGLSLFVPGDDQFRWHYLVGELERFNGAATPRQYSPCGVVLDTRSVVLVQRPERIYSWLSVASISLPECLLVPLCDGGPEPIGTLWVVSSETEHFTEAHAHTLTQVSKICGLGLQLVWTQEQLRAGLQDRGSLTLALDHQARKLAELTSALLRLRDGM